MAVRRGKRRGRRYGTPPSAQKSWYKLMVSLGALVMVLALGDQFASSAAGCYGAVSDSHEGAGQPQEKPEASQAPSTSPSRENTPVFLVKESDTTDPIPNATEADVISPP